MAQYTGSVKWFNHAKGFSFVGREDGAEVFCHYSSIESDRYKSLDEGNAVEFDLVQGEMGRPSAANVIRVTRNIGYRQMKSWVTGFGESAYSAAPRIKLIPC